MLRQAARSQRSLVAATIALEQLAGPVPDDVVGGRIAARAVEASRPARGFHSRNAWRFGAKNNEEFRNRHALQELSLLGCHGVATVVSQCHFRPLLAQRASQLRQVSNQEFFKHRVRIATHPSAVPCRRLSNRVAHPLGSSETTRIRITDILSLPPLALAKSISRCAFVFRASSTSSAAAI